MVAGPTVDGGIASGTQRRRYPPSGSNFSAWLSGLNTRK